MKIENNIANGVSIEKAIVIKKIKFKEYLENYPRNILQTDSITDHLTESIQKTKYEQNLNTAVKLFEDNNSATLINYILNTDRTYTKEEAVVIYKFVQEVIYNYGKEEPDLLKLGEASFFFFHDLLNGKISRA